MKHLFLILCSVFLSIGQLHGAEEAVKTLRGKAILGDVKNTVAGAAVVCRSSDLFLFKQLELKTDENGEFEIQVQKYPVYVEVLAPGGNFGKMLVVQPTDKEFTVSLEMTASVHGKIVDIRSDKPPVGKSVTYSIPIQHEDNVGVTISGMFKRETKTNEKGEYEFRNIPTGVICNINLPYCNYGENQPNGHGACTIDNQCELQPGENRELKNFEFDSRPDGAEEYFFQMCENQKPWNPGEDHSKRRFEMILENAKKDGKGVFVILVRDKQNEDDLKLLEAIYKTLFDTDDILEQTERFNLMCVLMQPKEEGLWRPIALSAKKFVKSHKIDAPLPALFSFAFFDADGQLRGVEPFDHTTPPEKQKENLIEMLKKY